MASVSKEELMLYCKVDEGDPREDLLVSLADGAESYLEEAGAYQTVGNQIRYKLLVMMMTLHDLDHPEGADYPAGIQRRINQLKFVKTKEE